MSMKPYARKKKYRIEDEFHDGIPATSKRIGRNKKEEIRNANRSLKKRIRQDAKKEIRKHL